MQDLVEEGILVSPRMMADHMPDYLTAVLKRMALEATRGPLQPPTAEVDPGRSPQQLTPGAEQHEVDKATAT